MKKVILIIFSLIFIFCGCSVSEQPGSGNNSDMDYVKSVWITYFELEQMTTSSETAQDFEKTIKSAFKLIKNIGLNTVTVQVVPARTHFTDRIISLYRNTASAYRAPS